MTEPQAPVPDWDSLPVLTEIVDTPEPAVELPPQAEVPVLVDFDIPDFDFSAEMAQLADALPDNELSFPPDLTLDEVLSAGEQSPDAAISGDGALDAEALIGRLPSLDLDVPLPDDMDLGEVLPGFAMPEVAADAAPVMADETAPVALWPMGTADAVLAEVEAEAAPSPAEMPLEADVAETLAAEPLSGDEVSLPAVGTPSDEEVVAAGVAEPSLADVDNAPLLDTVDAELTAATAAAGLAAWLDQAAQLAPVDAALQVDAQAEMVAETSTAPWEAPPPDAELVAAEVDMHAEAAESSSVLTMVPEPEAPPAAELDEVLPDHATAPAEANINEIAVPLLAPEVEAVAVAPEVTASDEVMAGADASPLGEVVAETPLPAAGPVAEEAVVTMEPPLLADEAAAPLAADAVVSATVADEEPVASDEFAFDLAAAEGVAPAGVAAAYVTALDAAPAPAEGDAAARGYPLGESISLDSLPTGVLGGGLGLAASLVAELDGGDGNDMMPDREVELAWARDLGAEPPFDLTPQDAILPVHQVLTAPSPAAEVPAATGLAAAAMQLSGVREVSQPLAVAPEAAASEALSSLTSEALIDALYARVLPRMKVELTLWMQDALEMQAKQLMSGVMQHLKEDFDMMLAEALRESLREALREAQAGQGER
ncbi:hypothetical protein C8E02_0693 [Vogesella indigofera]|uniref:Uncharacterized protein n=1 Tax=Vogesella indigofera TaxID=45465 RepID=A0A495BHV7_VOGIN|nr:hypothetical protein [Vogesella indigofera]RKQ60934.1 hypothetical protein C8E02_0693 [Vogesella indigofera]